MAAQMPININRVSPDPVELPPAQDVWASLARRVSSDPSPLDVRVGDQVFWTNNDSEPHWPGLSNQGTLIDKTFFMPNQIAADSSSDTFAPGVAETLEYVCSIHRNPPCSAPGTIVVESA